MATKTKGYKFKEGDSVVILDGSTFPEYAGGHWFSDGSKRRTTVGQIVTIDSVCTWYPNAYYVKENNHIYDERGLERASIG